jgi:transcriptional regulator with XRE-family HTH domain
MQPGEAFGPRLRQERERRQISLQSIAANTKIGVSLLAGLERDDVRGWPSGIFRRSFVRSYAAAIGADPEAVLREFLERFPDSKDPSRSPVPGPGTARPLRLALADEPLTHFHIVLRLRIPQWCAVWIHWLWPRRPVVRRTGVKRSSMLAVSEPEARFSERS